jgi:ATP-dependent RNA helicase RhlE
MALTFCDVDERPDFRAIEKLIRQDIPIVEGHPYESRVPFTEPPRGAAAAPARPSHGHGRRDLPSTGGGNGKRRRRRGGRGPAASA